MKRRIWHLKQCNLFANLAPTELARLEAASLCKTFTRGMSIYRTRQPADTVMLLVKGRVKLCSFSPEGKETILAFLEPGELFGELALFNTSPRDEDAEAQETSFVARLPATVLLSVMRLQPDLMLGISKLVGFRRRRIERRLSNLLFCSQRQRLIHLLCELAESYGEPDSQGIRLRIRLSHQELAAVIGASRETVTLLLRDFQAEELVDCGRRTLTIKNFDLLQAEAETGELGCSERSAPHLVSERREQRRTDVRAAKP